MSTSLTYTSPDFPFQPFTLIRSADVNQCFTDLSTFLNTTGVPVLQAGVVTTASIAANAVTAAKIANATITTTQISASAGITGSQLSASANIAGSQLAAAAGIVTAQLASKTIANTQVASGIFGGPIPAAYSVQGIANNGTANFVAAANQILLLEILATSGNVSITNTVSPGFTGAPILGTNHTWASFIVLPGVATQVSCDATGVATVLYVTLTNNA